MREVATLVRGRELATLISEFSHQHYAPVYAPDKSNDKGMKTMILVHGIHLYADNWQDIVWGNPEIGILGSATKALSIARELDADYMFWGTGASERDNMKESEYTFAFAANHAVAPMYNTLTKLKHYLDKESLNTKEEIIAASKFAIQKGIERIVLVSNPTHIARCLQTALAYFDEHQEYNTLRRNLTIAVSDVCFANSNPGDVAIFEPPHRGDQPKHRTHLLAKSVLALSKKRGIEFDFFLAEWRELITKFGGDKLV